MHDSCLKFEVCLFPGSLDVFADTGSRDKPSVTDYGLDPDSGSDGVGLEGFVQRSGSPFWCYQGICEVQPLCLLD